jgi:hypothetical protein
VRRAAALAIALVVVQACTDDESAAQPERSSPGPDRDVESYMGDGLTEAQARCVSQGYRGSGIPRIHMLEPPHGTTLGPDRLAAHEDLDVFLHAAEQACRDWITE